MNIWFFLWFVLSAILLGATGWSTYILFQQKQAWRKYAKKHGLNFTHGTTFGPCEMEGVVKGYNLSFFTAVQQNEDSRKNRQRTVMQLTANKPFVDGIAAGTQEVLTFLKSLDSLTEHSVKRGKWNPAHYIRSRNKPAVDKFLTEERVKILNNILSMPNADIVIILDDNEGIFRFETANPLKNAAQIETLVNKLMARVDKLIPTPEECRLFSAALTDVSVQPDLVDEILENSDLQLELEDDEEAQRDQTHPKLELE